MRESRIQFKDGDSFIIKAVHDGDTVIEQQLLVTVNLSALEKEIEQIVSDGPADTVGAIMDAVTRCMVNP